MELHPIDGAEQPPRRKVVTFSTIPPLSATRVIPAVTAEAFVNETFPIIYDPLRPGIHTYYLEVNQPGYMIAVHTHAEMVRTEDITSLIPFDPRKPAGPQNRPTKASRKEYPQAAEKTSKTSTHRPIKIKKEQEKPFEYYHVRSPLPGERPKTPSDPPCMKKVKRTLSATITSADVADSEMASHTVNPSPNPESNVDIRIHLRPNEAVFDDTESSAALQCNFSQPPPPIKRPSRTPEQHLSAAAERVTISPRDRMQEKPQMKITASLNTTQSARQVTATGYHPPLKTAKPIPPLMPAHAYRPQFNQVLTDEERQELETASRPPPRKYNQSQPSHYARNQRQGYTYNTARRGNNSNWNKHHSAPMKRPYAQPSQGDTLQNILGNPDLMRQLARRLADLNEPPTAPPQHPRHSDREDDERTPPNRHTPAPQDPQDEDSN